ncbi:Phytoene synthase [hydrothermal vent metagenome]|uniref:Phytoene synthase n=1 Tax=hydrothermal vent metagenome TaxID=652676 RepID=A0A3B0U0L4_9ZZZZ
MSENAGFVSSYLKINDPDRFTATLLLAEKTRSPVQALYAFGAEIAQVRDRISEPAAGEIRLQWWLDVLAGRRESEAGENPLAAQLLAVLKSFELPVPPLVRLLNARRFDLYDDPMADLNSFEGYAGETNSILYQLAAMIVNGGGDAAAAEAAGHLGVAHALVGHLRALPLTASGGRIVLPWSVFVATGASEKDYLAGKSSPEIRAGCAMLREKAQEHLHKADQAIVLLADDIRPVFAPVVLLKSQLKQLNKNARTPFITPPDLANWRKIASLAWWAYRN